MSWTLNICSLTLLRRHCFIGRVTRRVSSYLLVCTITFNSGIGVEPVLSCGNDVGGDVPDELDKEDVVDKPGTTIANGFTCNRRRKSACWTNSWQIFTNICRSNFGKDFADLCIDWVNVQWLLALVGGGNPSQGFLKLLLEFGWCIVKVGVLRTWSSPTKNNCPSTVLGIVANLGEITSFALSFTLWNSDASMFIHLLKVCYHESSFPSFSPRTRRTRRVIRVILCSRIGGISIEMEW